MNFATLLGFMYLDEMFKNLISSTASPMNKSECVVQHK